jgi:hypothetical protein
MELKLVIDDRIVAGARRLCTRRRVLVLLALTALSSAAAIAAPLGEAPFKFKEGQVVSSSQFNANFQALTDAIDAVDARFGTSFSVSPTSGFVGIGTKKPTSWLHVAGTLSRSSLGDHPPRWQRAGPRDLGRGGPRSRRRGQRDRRIYRVDDPATRRLRGSENCLLPGAT